MSKRKICVVITARPSYSRVKTALQAIKDHPLLELQLVVAASALLDRYGSAVNYIEQDGFEVTAKVFNVLEGENLTAAAKTTGIGILELSTVFDNIRPDIIVTIADRFETMATAISASFMNIPLAHIQGGEVTGNIDEKVRHSITKLADYHFVASASARERVIRLGEEPAYVINTGCPSIDLAASVKKSPALNFDPFEKYGGVGSKPSLAGGYIVVMQHPVTTEYADSRKHIDETLFAVKDSVLPVLWFWPNVDAGADGTSAGIRSFREKFGSTHIVNIGTRQHKRDRGNNIIDVGYNRDEIAKAIRFWIEKGKAEISTVYGGGDAGKQIAEQLATLPLKFHKTISY